MWIMMNNSFLSVVKNINQPDELLVIDYDNFKNSISFQDKKRHDIYFDVWIKLRELQIKTNE